MKKSFLNLILFGLSSASLFFLVLAVYLSDKALAGRLAVDLALISLGGTKCRFGIDWSIIQKSDRSIRFGLGELTWLIPIAAIAYGLVAGYAAKILDTQFLTALVALSAANEVLAAHLRNAGKHQSIYIVRIVAVILGVSSTLFVPILDDNTLVLVTLSIFTIVAVGFLLVGFVQIPRPERHEGVSIKASWLVERFNTFAYTNSLLANLVAKCDLILFAAMLPEHTLGDYAIIKQTLGILAFVSASFNYRYASDVRRLWQSGEREAFHDSFWLRTREATLLTLLGVVATIAILTVEAIAFDFPGIYTPIFIGLLVFYGLHAVASNSGMYLTAMGHVSYQTVRLVGSLALFIILSYTVSTIWPNSPFILLTYGFTISVLQIMVFFGVARLLRDSSTTK